MGQSVKVITKRADSPYVHELGLVAAELEQRYKDSKVSLPANPPPPAPPPFLSPPSPPSLHLYSPHLLVQRQLKQRHAYSNNAAMGPVKQQY